MKTVLLAGLAALLSSSGSAQPPSNGAQFIVFNLPLILCDTEEQVRAIFDAGIDKPNGGAQAKYREYFMQRNERGEPVCLIGPTRARYVYESFSLGMMPLGSGVEIRAFAMHLGNNAADGWAIYYEPAQGEEWRVDPVHRNKYI